MKVLTYNVSYKTIDIRKFGEDICKNIDKENFDFIGIQENKNLKQIDFFNKNSRKLNKMGYVNCHIGRTHILTYYNLRYNLLSVSWDTFYYNKEGGRPFHILLFEDSQNEDSYFLVINCHFPHLGSKKDLDEYIIKKLSNNVVYGYEVPSGKNTLKLDKDTKKKNIQHLFQDKNFNVIMMGDFNDKHKLNLYQGFKPFNTKKYRPTDRKGEEYSGYDTLPNLDKIQVGHSSISKPPPTCCYKFNNKKNIFEGKANRIGDYILVNNAFRIKEHNEILNPRGYLNSDHDPVYLEIELRKSNKFDENKSVFNCIEKVFR